MVACSQSSVLACELWASPRVVAPYEALRGVFAAVSPAQVEAAPSASVHFGTCPPWTPSLELDGEQAQTPRAFAVAIAAVAAAVVVSAATSAVVVVDIFAVAGRSFAVQKAPVAPTCVAAVAVAVAARNLVVAT